MRPRARPVGFPPSASPEASDAFACFVPSVEGEGPTTTPQNMTLEVDLTYVKGNKVVPNVSDDFDPFSPPTPSEYAPSEPSLDSESNNSNDTDHMLQEYMDGGNVEEEDKGSGWEGESDGSCTNNASASGVITNKEDDQDHRDQDREGHEEVSVSDGTKSHASHASHSSIIATSRPKRLASQGLQVFLEAAKNCGKSL